LPFNDAKCYAVSIPPRLSADFNISRHVIGGGIADTDGSVFTSDKKGSPNYPSIEITTVSRDLALQLHKILVAAGFRVANVRSYRSKLSTADCYKVGLYGKANLSKWVRDIGFGNPVKLEKALNALQQPFKT